MALHKQGVIDHRRISIKRNGENILTNTYILDFNSSTIPKEIKIGFNSRKCESLYTSSITVLQMPEIWAPQEHM